MVVDSLYRLRFAKGDIAIQPLLHNSSRGIVREIERHFVLHFVKRSDLRLILKDRINLAWHTNS
jgi:hypothetical protein